MENHPAEPHSDLFDVGDGGATIGAWVRLKYYQESWDENWHGESRILLSRGFPDEEGEVVAFDKATGSYTVAVGDKRRLVTGVRWSSFDIVRPAQEKKDGVKSPFFRDIQREVYAFAAALLKHHQITMYEGNPVREGCELTGLHWAALDAERRRLVNALAAQASVDPESLEFDECEL